MFCRPLLLRGTGEGRLFPKELLLDHSVSRLPWSQDSHVLHLRGPVANEVNQPSVNKICQAKQSSTHSPETLACTCAKKGDLWALSMHREGLQKADSLRKQGRRVPCPIKQIATVPASENRHQERLLLSALTILHSLRINGCYRIGCFSISGMQQHSTSGQWEQVNGPYLLKSDSVLLDFVFLPVGDQVFIRSSGI